MKRIFVASVAAALVIAIGSVGGSPAAAAPPTAPWSGSAGGNVADVTAVAVGLDVAGLGVAASDAVAGSSQTPRANSVSSNIAASVAGLPIAVESNSQSAPPDAGGPVAGSLLAVTTGLVDIGALTTTNEAHWDVDTACVTDGVLAAATTQTAGLDVLPLVSGGVLSLGVSQSQGQTSLVQNSGLNHGVQSVASGTVSGLSILGGLVTVDVAGTTTLTATASGASAGTVVYSPATVTVTSADGVVTLTPAAPSTTIDIIGVGTVTISLNDPVISTTGVSATATSSLLTVDVRLPAAPLPAVTDVSVDILPLNASAIVPASGIDCPPEPPVITTPTEGASTGATPEIAGTSEPNATVEVFVDGGSIGTTTADGTGNWTITPATPLAAGPHAATAIQTVAGTPSEASAPRNFVVDLTAPAPPVITDPANGDVVDTATPPITGTAEANSTVEVFVDGASIGTTTADGSGAWTITPVTPLSEGAHTAVATATDEAGNTSLDSAPVTFTVDTVAPGAPVITAPVDGSTTADPTPDIVGTAEAGSTVEVFIDGASAGTTTADGTGAWTLTPATPLAQGPHTVVANATDEAGNVSPDSNTVTFTVDSAAPAAPVITAPADGSSTSDTTPPISGSAEANSTVTVIIDGVPAGTTTADGTGAWTFTPPTPLAEGPHTAVATATDAAGNVSPDSNTVTFTIDTVAPVAPVITSPTDGDTVADSTPDIVGTAEANSTVTVIIDGTPVGTTTADGTGAWTFTPTTPLGDGDHTVVATATDAAGNESPDSNTVSFTVDTGAPAAPIITAPADASTIDDTTPDVVGTAEAGSTVEVFIDGTSIGTTIADGSGNWTLAPTTPLAQGPHTALATATDAGGNVSLDSNTVTFTIDSIAPAAPVITSPVEGSSTNDPTPPIVGIAEPNSTVTVVIDGVILGTTPVSPVGTWTFTPTTPLSDGPHTVTATAEDAAGNVSPGATPVTFTVDTVAPAAPVITSPANGDTVGDSTPEIVGTAESNAGVAVFIDGIIAGTTVADATGDWTFTPPTPLADGPHTVVAIASDAAGNVSLESNTVAFTVDTIAPAAPVITSPADGSSTDDRTPPVVGTAEANSTVEVTIDGAVAGETTADGTGAWTFTPTTPLADGPHTATATATDAAGNAGPVSNSVTFTVDATAPPAPVITSPADGSSTNDTTPPIVGTAEANTTVAVTIDGTVAGTTTADGTGAWTFTPGAPLPDGPHTVTATATDALGNVSPVSDEVGFTVDTLAPGAPVITSPAAGSTTGDTTPPIVGTAEANSTVTVTIDGIVAGTTTADGSGNWTFTPATPLAEGDHTVTATATDAAGNVSPPSAPISFAIDTTAPAPPVITSPADGSTTTDPTPPITGTAAPGSEVTVIVDGQPIGTTTADDQGNWTFTPTTPLPDGEHEITATATDPSGNTSGPSDPVVITVDTGASLPATGGGGMLMPALLGAMLVALGAGLFAVRRRRA